ncbi:hypothetical protein N431DRAFT_449635 [Stipitochalara longipes BDJ]|nr:hypothetical protein N431DRAFT_449635 [Stipitochalara longipes BDJ]
MKISSLKLIACLSLLPVLAHARWDLALWNSGDCSDNGNNAEFANDVNSGCVNIEALTSDPFFSGSAYSGAVTFYSNTDCTGTSCRPGDSPDQPQQHCCKGLGDQWRSYNAVA